MAAAQSLQEEQINRHQQAAPTYAVKDKMWLNLRHIKTDQPSKKLDTHHAKFIVLKCIGSHAYRLDTPPEIDNVFHIWLLRPAADDPFLSQRRADWQPPALITNDDGEEYEIKAILNERVVNCGRGRRHEYWVK